MIPGLENTPPEVAFLLGFFAASALERSRREGILNRVLPKSEKSEDKS